MLRRGFVVAAAALAAGSPAAAGVTQVMPGVTYSHTIEYTRAGPLSMHVVIAPRPGGLYALQPMLSNGTMTGRETVSSMERRLAPQATAIGINGDFFNWAAGYPTGVLVQGGVVQHHSHPLRSSIGVDATGTLRVGRVAFAGSWRAGDGIAHPVNVLNEPPKPRQLALYTRAWGRSTPAAKGTLEVAVAPLPPTRPAVEATGPVLEAPHPGPTQIPRDGAVLVARGGTATPALAAEALPGSPLTVRLSLRPESWNGVLEAIGGGPVLVRDGAPVYRSLEQLTPTQLFSREPRAVVGQRADGSIVLVAVDGRRGWYSVGITNYELAQRLVRLGCVTGSAVDSGGSVTVAFAGRVLNRPSDSYGERPVAEALLVTYAGVYAPEPAAVVSPNGDGVAEQERLTYKLVRPSTVAARLLGPGGVVRELESGLRQPGRRSFNWKARAPEGTLEPEGRWHFHVDSTDDLGRQSSTDRPFSLNTTLGFPRVAPRRVRSGGVSVAFTLARPASVRVTVETVAGDVMRTVASGRRDAGRWSVRWSGRDAKGRRLPRGFFVVRIAARNELGLVQQRLALSVR